MLVEHLGPVLGLQAALAGVDGEDGSRRRRNARRTSDSTSRASSIAVKRLEGLLQPLRRTGRILRLPARARHGRRRATRRPPLYASMVSRRRACLLRHGLRALPHRPRSPAARSARPAPPSWAVLSSMCRKPCASATRWATCSISFSSLSAIVIPYYQQNAPRLRAGRWSA